MQLQLLFLFPCLMKLSVTHFLAGSFVLPAVPAPGEFLAKAPGGFLGPAVAFDPCEFPPTQNIP